MQILVAISYNMLWLREKVGIIDVSQTVDITLPEALQFLYRDCSNVASFSYKKWSQLKHGRFHIL